MQLLNMQRLIKKQDRSMDIIKNIFFLGFMLLVGCSSHQVRKESFKEKLSCEEKAEPQSLQYLEQRYRCQSNR